jgi:hypothetical protein
MALLLRDPLSVLTYVTEPLAYATTLAKHLQGQEPR